ncbi:hypothetical protein SEA_MARKY_66 [Streptomyces phage Marky]|nr:hypothetical protein SEA_MARKY_66 [Streptomyces phage Marky]
MIKAECDRCGSQEPTPDTGGKLTLGLQVKTPLPEDWREVIIPSTISDAIRATRKQICPSCCVALEAFFEGDGAVPGLLSVETLEAVEAARPDGCIAHGGPDCICPDPRPNLTARAEVLSSAEAMEAIRTGEKAGRLLPCPEKAAQGRECKGWYEQGKGFLAHLEEAHPGLNAEGVANARHGCPYCAGAYKGVKLGEHIASEHPGEWEKWRSEGQPGW